MKRFGLNSERGAGMVGTVVTVIVAGAIGFFVVVKLLAGLDRSSFSASQNTTYDTYVSNTNTAFVLIALLAIVVAASAIINALS